MPDRSPASVTLLRAVTIVAGWPRILDERAGADDR